MSAPLCLTILAGGGRYRRPVNAHESNCTSWALEGNCNDASLQSHSCRPACTPTAAQCRQWAVAGECERAFMRESCAMSCAIQRNTGEATSPYEAVQRSEEVQHLKELWAWLKASGATGEVRVTRSKVSGLGVVTLKPLLKGDLMLTVPAKLMVTTASVKRGALAPVIAHASLSAKFERGEFSRYAAVALWLMHEKRLGEASEWWPYVRLLPPAAQLGSPSFYKPKKLRQLDGTYVRHDVSSLRSWVERFYRELLVPARTHFAELLPETHFGLKQLRWALATIMGRAVTHTVGGSYQLTLLPLYDHLNHEFAPESLSHGEDSAPPPYNQGLVFEGAGSAMRALVYAAPSCECMRT